MHQLEGLLRARGAQRFDDPVAQTAPAVHRKPGGLVEHEQALVLVHDRRADPRDECGRHARSGTARHQLRRLGALAHRGHAYALAGRHAALGTRAPPVDAHLALANQPENVRARHGRQELREQLVQSLARLFGGHLMLLHGRFRTVAGFPPLRHQKQSST